MRNPHHDLKPDFGTLKQQHANGLPRKVSLGQVDAGLNNGHRIAHIEFKDLQSNIDDWEDMRRKNIGQWLNYADMCRASKQSTVPFLTATAEGPFIDERTLHIEGRTVSRHMALLVWHTRYKEVDSEGFGFDAISSVVAWQWMFCEGSDDEPVYSPILSGYSKPDAWINTIHRFYGVHDTESGHLRCSRSKEAISFLNGQDLHSTSPEIISLL